MSSQAAAVLVMQGEGMASYGFGEGHPFGPDRHDVFHAELRRTGLAERVRLADAAPATRDTLASFHSRDYLDFVTARCRDGHGYLDAGDTPAMPGIDRAAAAVVGATLCALEQIMRGHVRRAFAPIAGLHHAGREHAAGFCVLNDCGVAIEVLRRDFGLRRIAYVDIDAHHGDGVFYAFEDDPDLLFADIHEDGRFLYPGTGHAHETGSGPAHGTKLNIPLEPGAGDAQFDAAWQRVEAYLRAGQPEFILMQCGADSLAGDPITHLRLTAGAHAHAAARLCALAEELGHGRVLATGGGGYDRSNLARAWTAVVESLVTSPLGDARSVEARVE